MVQGNRVPSAIARTAQEERRRREVDDARNAELAIDGFEAGDPEAGFFIVSFWPPASPPLSGRYRRPCPHRVSAR